MITFITVFSIIWTLLASYFYYALGKMRRTGKKITVATWRIVADMAVVSFLICRILGAF